MCATLFDSLWHILEIASGAHTVRPQWWSELPPRWERAGALYDHALLLARRTCLAPLERSRS